MVEYARRPAAFLMDEPLSNMDARLRSHMRAELKNIQKRLGITTVYVTHDQIEAMTLGDRVVVLNQGEVSQVGPPGEIYGNPRTLFVADFVGSPPMNQVRGRVRQGVFYAGDSKVAGPGRAAAHHRHRASRGGGVGGGGGPGCARVCRAGRRRAALCVAG